MGQRIATFSTGSSGTNPLAARTKGSNKINTNMRGGVNTAGTGKYDVANRIAKGDGGGSRKGAVPNNAANAGTSNRATLAKALKKQFESNYKATHPPRSPMLPRAS